MPLRLLAPLTPKFLHLFLIDQLHQLSFELPLDPPPAPPAPKVLAPVLFGPTSPSIVRVASRAPIGSPAHQVHTHAAAPPSSPFEPQAPPPAPAPVPEAAVPPALPISRAAEPAVPPEASPSRAPEIIRVRSSGRESPTIIRVGSPSSSRIGPSHVHIHHDGTGPRVTFRTTDPRSEPYYSNIPPTSSVSEPPSELQPPFEYSPSVGPSQEESEGTVRREASPPTELETPIRTDDYAELPATGPASPVETITPTRPPPLVERPGFGVHDLHALPSEGDRKSVV